MLIGQCNLLQISHKICQLVHSAGLRFLDRLAIMTLAKPQVDFLFLNNSAIAVQYLSKRGARLAILDIDVHHGNGTQEIFYDRNDIFTILLHIDPARFYRFLWGLTV